MFDHCHFENINSHSQTAVFKNWLIFGEKSSPNGSGCLRGGGVENLFGQNPFEQHLSFQGSSLRWANGPFCNRIVTFGHDFSKNTASIRAFNNQFCPKKSLGDNISHLDRGDFGGIGISCCIANNNVKLAFWVKIGLDLEPLLAFPDGNLHFPQPLCM